MFFDENFSKKSFILIILAILILGAGLFFLIKYNNDDFIGKVANKKFYSDTLNFQIKIENCYGDDKITSEIAAIKTINQFLESAVLKSALNLEPSKNDLKEKSALINKDTRAPEILDCVKKVFGSDINSYLQLYVAPTLINPKLHNQFSISPKINEEEINKIKEIGDSVKQGKKLEDFEEYRKFEIPKEIEIPPAFQLSRLNLDNSTSSNPLIEKVLKNLKPGEIWPDIIEDENGFQIIRLLNEDENKYYVDGVSIPKKTFDPWFRDYVKNNVKIEIKDEQLLSQIRQDYPTLWWLEIVNK